MKNLFNCEINESIATKATMNCLKNRNNHKQLNETSEFDARFEFRKDLRELASPAAKKAYMIIRKQYGDSMWRQLCMDDCDEQGLIEMLNMYAEDGLKPQQIVNKMMGVQEQEEDGINKGGMHNLVQVGHFMNTPSALDKLDAESFSDLEEREAYYENFRAISELVADQIDRENGKAIDNNMDTIFEIVREVWNNNPDDLYIWDFDDVQEDDCYKFFDKHYEEIKDEYMKREHNNIMDATHDDLFA